RTPPRRTTVRGSLARRTRPNSGQPSQSPCRDPPSKISGSGLAQHRVDWVDVTTLVPGPGGSRQSDDWIRRLESPVWRARRPRLRSAQREVELRPGRDPELGVRPVEM